MGYFSGFLLSLMIVAPVWAADEPDGTRINLSATAEITVPNNEVVISFRVEKQGANASKIRQQVNHITAAIKKRLDKEVGVKLTTTNRHMRPIWKHPKNAPRVRTGWTMVQSGQISSTSLAKVPDWLSAIEAAGAHLSGLQFRVSHEATMHAKESLRQQAIGIFRQKAAAVAKELSASSFRILRLNTNSSIPGPRMYKGEMAMMSAADVAAPALSAGEGSVRVTVSGEIELPFKDFQLQ